MNQDSENFIGLTNENSEMIQQDTQKNQNPQMAGFMNQGALDILSKKIYQTVFKKGHLVQTLHFEHPGPLPSAVADIKNFLQNNHLKHIHTVPFLISLDRPDSLEEGFAISTSSG